MPAPRTARALVTISVLGATMALALAACAPEPSPTPRPSATATAESVSPSPTPTLEPGSAEALRSTFTDVVEAVWSDGRSVAGRDYIDALVAAGFERDAMQVTQDRTSVDDPADSIQFSVHIGEDCLVGQVGPSVRGPIVALLPETPGETCLIGQTRPIDW
ncbi:DUF6993 domain-containing protein [Microbacterium dauci]|uniref:DUF6993 domain-containing protein n=1 Tax=Microbacterium dauci TaxID=3048008 RepID=A0ABT6ZBZ3_9MICO|nr:hypothetical protein [Microbacterium sp. LX3-4]MDJ1113680.1 hypothetical protein [Microbacterium sp. LX3-4]